MFASDSFAKMNRFLVAAWLVTLGASVSAEEELAASKNLSFFGRFAAEKNRNKFDGPLDCVYGHPVKGKMCPPVMNDPMAPIKSHEGGEGASSFETLTGGIIRFIYGDDFEAEKQEEALKTKETEHEEEESALSLFSRCLDDPDSPECRELQVGVVSPSSHIASAPGHGRNLIATTSPTIDDCGGNMFDPRFCASQMPSISNAPTSEDDKLLPPPTSDKTAPPETSEPTFGTDGFDSSQSGPDGDDETAEPSPAPSPIPTVAATECASREEVVNFVLEEGDPTLCSPADTTFNFVSRSHLFAVLMVDQLWVDGGNGLDWMAAVYTDSTGSSSCVVDRNIAYDIDTTYSIACGEGEWATIELYISDSTFASSNFVTLDSSCPSDVASGVDVCKYSAMLTCECLASSGSVSLNCEIGKT